MKRSIVIMLILLVSSCGTKQENLGATSSKQPDSVVISSNEEKIYFGQNNTHNQGIDTSVNNVNSLAETNNESDPSQTIYNEIDTIVSRLLKVDTLKTTLLTVGSRIVLNNFEKRWYVNENSLSEKWLSDLSTHFGGQNSSNEIWTMTFDSKFFHSLFNIKPTDSEIWKRKVLDEQFSVIVMNVAEHTNCKLYSILTNMLRMDDYGDYDFPVQIQSLISFSNNKVDDNLIVAYEMGGSLGASSQYFFYDRELIHIKKFGGSDDIEGYDGYQQYKITPQGRFVRYYEQDGILKDNDNIIGEQGMVKNNTREGKWVDMDNAFYIDSEFRNGLPIGEWQYYKIIQKFTDEGYPILSSRQKGELLYTETYENGRMIKREFVKEPNGS